MVLDLGELRVSQRKPQFSRYCDMLDKCNEAVKSAHKYVEDRRVNDFLRKNRLCPPPKGKTEEREFETTGYRTLDDDLLEDLHLTGSTQELLWTSSVGKL